MDGNCLMSAFPTQAFEKRYSTYQLHCLVMMSHYSADWLTVSLFLNIKKCYLSKQDGSLFGHDTILLLLWILLMGSYKNLQFFNREGIYSTRRAYNWYMYTTILHNNLMQQFTSRYTWYFWQYLVSSQILCLSRGQLSQWWKNKAMSTIKKDKKGDNPGIQCKSLPS